MFLLVYLIFYLILMLIGRYNHHTNYALTLGCAEAQLSLFPPLARTHTAPATTGPEHLLM